MHDSRLGTMGALGLMYFYMLVIGSGIVIVDQMPLWQLVGLTAIMTMVAKTGIALLFYKMVYNGDTGLASIWVGVKTWRIVASQVLAIVVISAVLQWQGLVSYLAMIVFAYFYRRFHIHLLKGFSGDTIGAFGELSQVIFLLVYSGIIEVLK